MLVTQRFLISFWILWVVETTSGAAILGFKRCDPSKDRINCHAVGQFGQTCNESLPCARGLYCKQRSLKTFYCDNGVEETHQNLKRLITGCLDTTGSHGTGVEQTAVEIRTLLDSYHLNEDEKTYLEDENHFVDGKDSRLKNRFCSIQEMAAYSCNGKRSCLRTTRVEQITQGVIDELIGKQTNLPATDDYMELYKTDSHSPVELRNAGGFFGKNPITTSHARLLGPLLASYTSEEGEPTKKADEFLNMPFIATTESSLMPKGSPYQYMVRLPIPTSNRGDPTKLHRQLIFNGNTLADSQLIGLRSGRNIAFLTGLSASFIQGVNSISGKGFIPINEAVRHDLHQTKQTSQQYLAMDIPDRSKGDNTDKKANIDY